MKKLPIMIIIGCFIASGLAAQQNNNMVRINGGTFTMGSPANEPNRDSDEIQKQVTVGAFWMGKYEVTQKEYREIMGENPSNFKGDNLPVENVTWFKAAEYCNRRSYKEGLTLSYTIDQEKNTVTWNRQATGYRLPTEAEWEYACRAGTRTAYNTGNTIITAQANFDGSDLLLSETVNEFGIVTRNTGEYREKTTPVGSFAPNAWGLYDMHGNVWEWCWDWYGNYATGAQTNPTGAVAGGFRVLRGGSWHNSAGSTRSGYRGYDDPDYGFNGVGFRLVRP